MASQVGFKGAFQIHLENFDMSLSIDKTLVWGGILKIKGLGKSYSQVWYGILRVFSLST
jgi:hypothetical protein